MGMIIGVIIAVCFVMTLLMPPDPAKREEWKREFFSANPLRSLLGFVMCTLYLVEYVGWYVIYNFVILLWKSLRVIVPVGFLLLVMKYIVWRFL